MNRAVRVGLEKLRHRGRTWLDAKDPPAGTFAGLFHRYPEGDGSRGRRRRHTRRRGPAGRGASGQSAFASHGPLGQRAMSVRPPAPWGLRRARRGPVAMRTPITNICQGRIVPCPRQGGRGERRWCPRRAHRARSPMCEFMPEELPKQMPYVLEEFTRCDAHRNKAAALAVTAQKAVVFGALHGAAGED